MSLKRFHYCFAAVLSIAIAPVEGTCIDLFGPPKLKKPTHTNIKFWDFTQERERGIHALFYTVLNDRSNLAVDTRLYRAMTQLLEQMCEKVVTIHTFTDPQEQRMVEQAVAQLVDEWHLQSRITPESFFRQIPFLPVDIVVFMERTQYEQVWIKKTKQLAIGLKLAVFEMDTGEPLYNRQHIEQRPWFGEDASFAKVEYEVLLDIANEIGAELRQTADAINQVRRRQLEEAARLEALEHDKEIAAIRDENLKIMEWLKPIESVVQRKEPVELIGPLADDVARLKQLIKKSPDSFSPDDIAERQRLVGSIERRMDEYNQWDAIREEQRIAGEEARKPVLNPNAASELPVSTPVSAPEHIEPPTGGASDSAAPSPEAPLPRIRANLENPFNRNWLLPRNRDVSPGPATGAVSTPASKPFQWWPSYDTGLRGAPPLRPLPRSPLYIPPHSGVIRSGTLP